MKKERAKRALPSWASDKFPQPEMGKGITEKKNFTLPTKVTPQESYYNLRKKNAIKKVLTTEW